MGDTVALLAKELTQDIPILFVGGVGDPIAAGLVKSLVRPEANVTGVSNRTDLEMQGSPKPIASPRNKTETTNFMLFILVTSFPANSRPLLCVTRTNRKIFRQENIL
jgi:hypothetical protein